MGSGQTSAQRPTPPCIQPVDNVLQADEVEPNAETAQSALPVTLKLVISGMTRALIVSSKVTFQFWVLG